MSFRNKVIVFMLLFSLIFTSKAFVVFAERESTLLVESTEVVEETEIIEEIVMTEEIEVTEPEEDSQTLADDETIDEIEIIAETEAIEETEIIDETTLEESEITEETTMQDEIKGVANDKLLGDADPKFRFAYFKEDMSVGLYTFDYVGWGVIPDAVTIATNNLEALVYPEKRYSGAVDLGFEIYNISWLEDNYKWDDPNIYSDSPMSLSDAYSNWCTGSTLEDELYCANYAKLTEMTIIGNTIDTEYYIGEEFDPTGLKVDVKFANNKTANIEYTDSTKDHFKFYDNDTGDEYTTDTDVNANFTLKIVYGDVEHGSDAVSTISATIDIVAIDPAGEKGFKVYCQKLDDTIECIDYVNGTSSEEFTETIRQFINGEEVASDMVAYQGCYLLSTYGGTDYEPYRTWNDTDVFSFESEFKNKVDEWLDGGKTENKSVGIILQRRQYGNERGLIYFWHFTSDGTVVRDSYTEIIRMEVFDELIAAINNGIPSQYNSITGYYKDAYIDYQFYRPDRRPTENYAGLRDLIIRWKENPSSFSASDARKICIAYERKTPDSIMVSTMPTKTNYQTGERFNPEGLIVTVSYLGNINDEIPCDSFRKYLFTFDPTTDTDLTGANDKITITCCDKSVDLPIYVEPEVDSISISTMMTYDTYSVGEKLDPNGLSINVNYVGGSSREVVYNAASASSFGFNPALNYTYVVSDVGAKSYTLTYSGKETSFDVNVLENNKFVVLYDVAGVTQARVLEAGDSNIETVLNEALQNGFAGFYNVNAVGYCDSKKKYDKTTVLTLSKNQTLELFNAFTGSENIFVGAAVQAPTPPTPTPPYNPGGGGGSTGGGGGGSGVGPMPNLPLEQALQNSKLNSTNNIPQNHLIVNAEFAISLLSVPENEIIPKINIIDENGNTGFGKWLNVPGTNNWLFLAGDLAVNGTLGTAGFVSNGFYNLSWGLASGWYHFDSNGMIQTGWQNINGKRYYFEPNPNDANYGVAAVGFKMIEGQVYRFDANGVLDTSYLPNR